MTNNGAAHAALKRDIMLEIGADPRCRIFSNSVGLAVDPKSGAHVAFGLVEGASDILGIVKPHGRWLALEVKTGKARPTKAQKRFLEMIVAFGGVGEVVRSKEDAERALQMAVLPRAA